MSSLKENKKCATLLESWPTATLFPGVVFHTGQCVIWGTPTTETLNVGPQSKDGKLGRGTYLTGR